MAQTGTIRDIRGIDPGFRPNQHCTYPNQDGVDDYSFSHTAEYCGRPQPRRCGCPFDYPERDALEDRLRDLANRLEGEDDSDAAELIRSAADMIEELS